MFDRKEIISCKCSTLSHVVGIELIEWGNFLNNSSDIIEPELYIETVCSPYLPWYKRIVCATKYIFGHSASSPSFGATIVSPDSVDKILSIISDYKDLYEKYKSSMED